jgi:hypothetical protein
MNRYLGTSSSSAVLRLGSCGIAAVAGLLCAATIVAATPFNEATVTRLQASVKYGEVKGGTTTARPAAVNDVVRAKNFLLTETDARAELKYEDGSVVRIGQNTVFSFEANTRTLALEKGTLIFFIPKGTGGGQIKTPSLTAAITGTVGKVSPNMIAILEGEVTLVPSGQIVRAGFFARRNPDGTITIARFDMQSAMGGRLMTFAGPMPGFTPVAGPRLGLDLRQLDVLEALQRTSNMPSAIENFSPQETPDPPKVGQEEPAAPPSAEPPPPPPPAPRPRPDPRPRE